MRMVPTAFKASIWLGNAAGAIAIGDYTEAAAVVVLFGLAEWLEARATGRARDAISAVLALKPATAVLAATGEVFVYEFPYEGLSNLLCFGS